MELSVVPPSSPPSMTTDSTQSSPSSMNTEPYHQPLPTWRQVKPVSSWLSSRTMKRHRDDRPSEETIHNSTLQKLYEAQKHPETAEAIIVDIEDLDQDVDLTDEPMTLEPPTTLEPEPDQRSILNFFRLQSPLQQPSMAEQHISMQGMTEQVAPDTGISAPIDMPYATQQKQDYRERLWNAFERVTGIPESSGQ